MRLMLIRSSALAATVIALACSGDTGGPAGVTSFGGNFGWVCLQSQNCQDVFNLSVMAGTALNIRVTNVSSGSVSQLALYGPGVALGGINLLTGTMAERRCTAGEGCVDFTAGEQVLNYTATETGTYRLAVTRDWGWSCGGQGTYRLDVTASQNIQVLGQTVEDQLSVATTFSCQ